MPAKGDEPRTAANLVRPAAPPKPPDLPESLAGLWDQLVEALDEAGIVGNCDGLAIGLALRHYLLACKAFDELAAAGSLVVQDPAHGAGQQKKHPAAQVFAVNSAAFLEFAKQLGLTFVSRARVAVKDSGAGAETNPFAAASSG